MKHGHKPQNKAAKTVKKASGGKNGKEGAAVKAKSSREAVKSGSKAAVAKIAIKGKAVKAGSKGVVKASPKASPKASAKAPAKSSGKAETRPAVPKITPGRKAADQKHDPRAITFTNPVIGHAFRRAVKKYPVALKRLSD